MGGRSAGGSAELTSYHAGGRESQQFHLCQRCHRLRLEESSLRKGPDLKELFELRSPGPLVTSGLRFKKHFAMTRVKL